MKLSVEINLPANKVVELFLNRTHFNKWKKDFINSEHISGIDNEIGSKNRLAFKRITMIETVISNNLPHAISYEYEHKQGNKTIMIHKATNRFTFLDENRTLYELDSEVIKVYGKLLKIIMSLMKKAGEKYARTQLDQFKAFAEKQD